jgi:Holliday junction DNA helicase RuvB
VDDKERLVTPRQLNGEEELDEQIRPRRLDEFVGQDKVKENLRVFVEAARMRTEPLEHVLLFGPPGLGSSSTRFTAPARRSRSSCTRRLRTTSST